MIAPIVFISTILILLAMVLYHHKAYSNVHYDRKSSIPVEFDILEEHKIPLITLTNQKGEKQTFLVDTGANQNYIDKGCVEADTVPESQETFFGVDGTIKEGFSCSLCFTYRNSKLEDKYTVTDLQAMIKELQAIIGKKVHGILGVPFLRKHNMTLDINRMIVWKGL